MTTNAIPRLELNKQYLHNVFQYLDSAIMIVDENEEFLVWNNGAEKIFGYTQEEIIGRNSSALLPDGKKYLEELTNIIDEVKLNGFAKVIETERRTKDNRIIPVQLNVAMLPGENNSYAGRTVVITDVSEVRKLQQQVDQSEKLAVIGQLAAGVAHEIGNPLAAISSIVQILQRKSTDQFTSDQLANVKDNINRISKIVRELVDLSRPPSHDEVITQINEVIKTAVGIVKYDKRVRKVEFKTYLDENLPMIKVVPDQLIQVFINILINSLDAIEGSGIIKVKSSYNDKFIFVSIIDNGSGMDEKVIAKVFDPFFTTKEVGKGTGLGLSVSYGIIKKFNGDIKITSSPEKGSEFQVQIPI
ncbi:MAG: PAS domain S-box protein [Ignavibacteriae bacterium]|nr:PAS domain S-box protein [Ignavibacteriota bacterium]